MMRIAAGVLLLVALTACGGSSSTPTQTPTPTPTPVQTCSQSVIDHGNGSVNGSTLYYNDISVAQSGRLDFNIDWTFNTSVIGIYLVPANTCTLSEFNAGTCNFLMHSAGATTPKPRKESVNVSAGSYRWLFANFSDVQESVAFQIVLSTGGGCPPISRALSSSEGQARHLDHIAPLR